MGRLESLAERQGSDIAVQSVLVVSRAVPRQLWAIVRPFCAVLEASWSIVAAFVAGRRCLGNHRRQHRRLGYPPRSSKRPGSPGGPPRCVSNTLIFRRRFSEVFCPWRVPYPMRAAAIPMADLQLRLPGLPGPRFRIQGFVIQGLRHIGAFWNRFRGPSKFLGDRFGLS